MLNFKAVFSKPSNNIFSLIDCYYSMCHNKSNILLYIIGLYNDDTLSILEKIKKRI